MCLIKYIKKAMLKMHRKNPENEAIGSKYSLEISQELTDCIGRGITEKDHSANNLDKKDNRDGSFSSHMVRKVIEDNERFNDK